MATANNIQSTTSLIEARPNSVITTRELLVKATTVVIVTLTSALRDTTTGLKLGLNNRVVTPNRQIDWNSNVFILGAESPKLVVDAAGNVIEAINVSITDTDGQTRGPVAVDSIVVNPSLIQIGDVGRTRHARSAGSCSADR